jgi:hypothetical protein
MGQTMTKNLVVQSSLQTAVLGRIMIDRVWRVQKGGARACLLATSIIRLNTLTVPLPLALDA